MYRDSHESRWTGPNVQKLEVSRRTPVRGEREFTLAQKDHTRMFSDRATGHRHKPDKQGHKTYVARGLSQSSDTWRVGAAAFSRHSRQSRFISRCQTRHFSPYDGPIVDCFVSERYSKTTT